MDCTICHKPIELVPSAMKRLNDDRPRCGCSLCGTPHAVCMGYKHPVEPCTCVSKGAR